MLARFKNLIFIIATGHQITNSMHVGEINVLQAIIELELRVGTLERGLDFISKNNSKLVQPSQAQIERFREETVAQLQKVYPSLGIHSK